mmetsp:Transcript_51395/g.135560  ORF Transcript_51395/g.135560 Transcript_51395/m.135560 type:complete len:755 (-) Transcript_51395:188-2452(-)
MPCGVNNTSIDLHAIPNLPGFTPQTIKDKHHRSQAWGFVSGQRMEFKEGLSHDKPKFVKAPRAKPSWRQGTLPMSTTREVFSVMQPEELAEMPAWDAYDRHVLRFYGYFKEAVVETNLENYRIRRCIVYYYLEDDTMHITEPRQDNSGIPQGTLIRRHRFPAESGGYLTPRHLQVGQAVRIYGKVIQLTDCDQFTREYSKSIGMDQPSPEEIPRDLFDEARGESMVARPAAMERTYEKLFREVSLGGGHINENQQQFMENDRKVCRFFCVMDDMATTQYERRPFTLLFFLADNTVEIREQYPLNCGRDNFPIFFRRGKLPKTGGAEVRGPADAVGTSDEYFNVNDFFVGQRLQLVGHDFFVYDCDQFTRAFFREHLGQELIDKIDVRLPDQQPDRPPTPPYTGFGTWDDSMGSVLSLVPKVPKKDFHKMMTQDGKILRFTAKFVDAKPEDAQRRFVINYHLFDDTVSVHEPPQRNLGVVTGKFLEKGVHLNQMSGKLFEPRDLLPGNIVQVFNHVFEVLDMDEYTAKYMNDVKPPYPSVDLPSIVEKIRESLRQQFPLVRDIFRKFDRDHSGVITFEEMDEILKKFGFQLSREEVMALFRHFDSAHDGQVSYNEFCDTLLDEDYSTRMLNRKPMIETTQDQGFASRAVQRTLQRGETERVRRATRSVGEVLYQKTGLVAKLRSELHRMTAGRGNQVVTSEELRYAFLQTGHAFELEDIERAILFVMPEVDLNAIPYITLFEGFEASYHDLAAIR